MRQKPARRLPARQKRRRSGRNNTTQLATTAFVQAALIALVNGAPATLDTLKEIAAAINNDPNFSTTINNALALKAPLASPA
jgi:hypothetical protein